MELDLSREWRLFLAQEDEGFAPPCLVQSLLDSRCAPIDSPARSAAEFAVAELSLGLELLAGLRLGAGDGTEGEEPGIIILSPGACVPGPRSRKGYAWRASAGRVEIHGDSGAGLLAGVEAFLEAAGLFWPAPGLPARLARPGRVELEAQAGRRSPEASLATLILGHGAYLEAAADYLPWAARNGYGGVFFHTTTEALALGACPLSAYEARRAGLLPLLGRLGLEVELGGHGLSSLLSRRLFKTDPELFRMAGGRRRPDANLCPSSAQGLEMISANFLSFVEAHPEAGVFHVWPDDLPGGGWCECPACASLTPEAQSLAVARVLASVLETARPAALLSFLAYHDTEGPLPAGGVPPNLDLLWAPRKRSWAQAYGDPGSSLNAASAGRLEEARGPFSTGGMPRVSIFEYWEDAILFKAAVPPLGGTLAGDLLHYVPRAARIGILLTGAGLPLAPRPNPWLLPRLLAAANRPGAGPETQAAELARLGELWTSLLYGGAAGAMAAYWKALEEAWRIDLDLEPGDTELHQPPAGLGLVEDPPADWGDPWTASPERLAQRRARCDALFDLLREAESRLDEARGLAMSGNGDGALEMVEAEEREYAVSSCVLELDCARLAAYHEGARGQGRLSADIALIGLGMMYSARRAMRAQPDPRARLNGAFLLELFYGLRFRSLGRAVRGPVLRGYNLLTARLRLGLAARRMRRLWEKA